jgi:hypothetical protein
MKQENIKETLLYCLPHVQYMWAAVVIAKLLNCDFREAETEAKKYLESISVKLEVHNAN